MLSFGSTMQFTEVRFASFLSGGFIPAIVVNPPERKLAKRTSVHFGQNFLSSLIVLSFESHDSKMTTCLKTANSVKAKRKSWLG